MEHRVEVSDDNGDGLVGRWLHEPDGPWQATAPGWAVREFSNIRQMVKDGKWRGDHPVGPLLVGHVVHCDGIWDNGECVVEPSRNTYYQATVKWSDGETRPLALWRY